MSRSVKRIAFYLRKVKEYNEARYSLLIGRAAQRPPASRSCRLLAYKTALNERLESERSDVH